MLNNRDYLDIHYTNANPTSFPCRVTVKAYMLLIFRNRIHSRENPAIENGATITLIGKAYDRYLFKTGDGYVGEAYRDAFELCHDR